MFRAQLDGLKGRFRVIAPDLPGFGRTPLSRPRSMDEQADLVLGLLDALKIPVATVGGVSMGGYLSFALLRRGADRVSGLALIDTQVMADEPAAKEKRYENAARMERQGTGFYVDQMAPKLVGKGAGEEVRKTVRALMARQSKEGAAAGLRAMAERPDSRDMLARFCGKVMVLVGEEDETTPLSKARQMAELASNAELVVVPKAGHLSNLDAPEAVNAALARLLLGAP